MVGRESILLMLGRVGQIQCCCDIHMVRADARSRLFRLLQVFYHEWLVIYPSTRNHRFFNFATCISRRNEGRRENPPMLRRKLRLFHSTAESPIHL